MKIDAEPNIAFVYAAPRTGSTALMGELAAAESVINLDEVFHPKITHRIVPECKEYLESRGVDVSGENFAHRQPLKVFRGIVDFYREAGADTLLFSLFPGHLNMANQLRLMGEYPVRAAILQRRPIDMYISQAKAQETGKYADIDTTEILPEIDQNAYVGWYFSMHNWYAAQVSLLRKVDFPIRFVHFERYFAEVRHKQEYDALCRFLGIEPIAEGPPSRMRRQDQARNWPAKIKRLNRKLDIGFGVGYDFFSNHFIDSTKTWS